MTRQRHNTTLTLVVALLLCMTWSATAAAAAPDRSSIANNNSPSHHLRALPSSLHVHSLPDSKARDSQRRLTSTPARRLQKQDDDDEEALEVIPVQEKESVDKQTGSSGSGDNASKEQVDKDHSADGASSNQDKDNSSSDRNSSASSSSQKSASTPKVPSAKPAEYETEDPLLMQEDSTSAILLNVSLSLTAQRVLAFLAALLAMIWTAYEMSENPDGLYAALCRSILTGIRVVCRIVTCKACWDGIGVGGMHRHVPISTMDAY